MYLNLNLRKYLLSYLNALHTVGNKPCKNEFMYT